MKQKITNNQIQDKKVVDGIRERNVNLRIPNVEYRTKPQSNVLYFGLKLVGVLSLALILSFGFGKVGSTVSYFNDMEGALGNFMQADPLTFTVEIASSTSAQIDLSKGKTIVTPVMTPGPDSEDIQYLVKSEIVSGDKELCDSVHMTGTWPFPFDSNLTSLVTGTTTSTGAWTLELGVSDYTLFVNKTCSIDLLYEGWNNGSEYGRGYKDSHKVTLMFSAPEQAPIPVPSNLEMLTIPEISTSTPQSVEEENPVTEEVTVPEQEATPETSELPTETSTTAETAPETI